MSTEQTMSIGRSGCIAACLGLSLIGADAAAQVCGPAGGPMGGPAGGFVPGRVSIPGYAPYRSPPYPIPNPGYHFSGIGGVGSQIDLLSNPASQMCYPTRMPTFQYSTPCFVAPPCPVYPTPYAATGNSGMYPGGYATPGYGYGTSAYVSSGSGLTVNGRYSNDNWKVGFHLGTSPTAFVGGNCGPIYQTPVCSYPLWGWTNIYGSYWGSYYPYSYSTYPVGPNTYGNDPRLWKQTTTQPAAQPAQPPEPPTAVEVGKAALAENQPKYAVEAFRRALKENGNEPTTMRFLAIALAENKQLEDAASVMRSAYRLDPSLASDPIELFGLGYTEREFRDFTARCVTAANSDNTASSWMLVAALMQAEGRLDPAKRALEKAKKLGLEADVVVEMTAAMSR